MSIAIIDFGCGNTKKIYHFVTVCVSTLARIYASDNIEAKELVNDNTKGIILTGGPKSVCDDVFPNLSDKTIFNMNVPILGICYGAQLLVKMHPGGEVTKNRLPEFGVISVSKTDAGKISPLFCENETKVFDVRMSHYDSITKAPDSWTVTAISQDTKQIAALENQEKTRFALQFHPEVSTDGKRILRNFLCNVID